MTPSPHSPSPASSGVALTDAEGRITSASPDLLALLGRPAHVVVGGFVTDLVSPPDVPALAGAYRRALDGDRSTPCRLHLVESGDGTRVVEARVFVARDAEGRVRSVALTLEPWTEEESPDPRDGAFREQAARLGTIIDGAQLGTWEWHIPSGSISFNERWAGILGYGLDEIAPNLASWERLVHPDDLDEVMAVLSDHLEGRTPLYRTEHRLRHKQGHDVWVLDMGRVLEWDDDGRPVRAAGIHLDVTERVLALAAARESLAKFRALFESQPLGVAVTDPAGEIVEVNAVAQEFLGLTAEEQTDRDIEDDRWTILRPDGTEMPTGEYASVVALREGRRVENVEMIVQRPDGTWRSLSVSAAPVDHPDYGVVISYTDITDVRAEEARSRAIFESMKDVVFTLHPDGTYASARGGVGSELLRGLDLSELVGMHRAEVVGDDPVHADAERRALAGEHVVYEWPMDTPTGRRRVQTSLSPVFDARGSVGTVVGVARDLTDRAALEEARLEMQRRAVEVQKAESLAVLAGGVAHDFNNLLSGVLLNAELALEAVGRGSATRELLDDIVSSAERATELARQMLAYSGRGAIHVTRVDANDVLRSMRSALRAAVPPQVSLDFDLADALPPLEGDQTQVWQVVYNVTANAADSLAGQPGRIRISSRSIDFDPDATTLRGERAHLAPGEYVEVRVEDTGSGVDPDAADRLFEPFFTTKFQGRGLGLPAAQGIMQAHGGAILFDGARTDGAAFHLLFPRAPGDAPSDSGPVATAPSPRRRGTILLADDEQVVRRAGTRLLEALDYHVVEAEDGEAALDAWEAHRDDVDLVILDVVMPRLDGRQTLARLRERAPDLKVLLTSGFQSSDVLGDGEGPAPDGFIEKPFRLDTVRERVEAALESGNG